MVGVGVYLKCNYALLAMTTLYLEDLKPGHSKLFIDGVAEVTNTACIAGEQIGCGGRGVGHASPEKF